MPTKITFIIDNPANPEDFERAYLAFSAKARPVFQGD